MHSSKRIRHVFEVRDPERYKATKHYELIECSSQKPYLKAWANIAINRNFNKSNDSEYLYKGKEEGESWSSLITGLRITPFKNVYFGDICAANKGYKHKEHLLIFGLVNDGKKLVIDVFLNFYPSNEIAFISRLIENKKRVQIKLHPICSNNNAFGNTSGVNIQNSLLWMWD